MNRQPELPEYYRDLEIAQALNKLRQETHSEFPEHDDDESEPP